MPIKGPVSVPEPQPARHRSFDDERPSMNQFMMLAAKQNHLIDIVFAPFRHGNQMVNVNEHGAATTWHRAAPAVAPHDLSPERRRNGLERASRLAGHRPAHVGVTLYHPPAPLRMAGRLLVDFISHPIVLSAHLLEALSKALARVYRNLIVRATRILAPTENMPRHHQERFVLIELAA